MFEPSDELFAFPFHSDSDLSKLKDDRRRHVSTGAKVKWRSLAKKALQVSDPWEGLNLDLINVEECLRYRYSSVRQKWVTDTVYVKMEDTAFGHGAMRECFRLKKSNEPDADWSRELNYVAKRYIAEVPRETYFEDVRLQMDAKLWAEEFNRHNPPKKIDIFQVSIIEFVNRQDKSLYHLEHFIDGNYIKYNSNSGYVNSVYRQTPQAFSHFTFERSGHQLIVVDVQGVGDLYTDPQVHTFDGKGYGDGNLGTRGMALFFYSHCCNSICESMGLTKFDLAPAERAARKRSFVPKFSQSETLFRLSEVDKCISPARSLAAMEFVRARSVSSVASNDAFSSESFSYGDVFDGGNSSECHSSNGSVNDSGVSFSPVRCRFDSDVDSSSGTVKEVYWEAKRRQSRPACMMVPEIAVSDESKPPIAAADHSTLARIHIDLVRYHELGRFCQPDKPYDRASAWFHLNAAANCGIHEAVMTLASIYLGLPHDLLRDFKTDEMDDEDAVNTGLDWMEKAASHMHDRSAMLYMAEAFRSGLRLGSERRQSYAEALKWYQLLLQSYDNMLADDDDTPKHEILASVAELYKAGGPELDRNLAEAAAYYSKAAEAATEAMRGKLATKYFILAEEANAEMDE